MTSVAGVAALQRLTGGFCAHLWEAIWSASTAVSPFLPSTETILSPGLSTLRAGKPLSRLPTRVVAVVGPIAQKKTNSRMEASTRFTAGPAEITTIRFHTGCE